MTSEIRANTIKNRVGLGTVSFTNTGSVVSGIVTANTLRLPDSTSGSLGRVQLGNGLDLSLFHDGFNSFLVNNTGYLSIQSQDGVNGIFIARNAEVNLYYGSSVRLQTSSSGVTINRDLDVDGHTNLDNVSIAGITTMGNRLNVAAGIDITASTSNLYATDGALSYYAANNGVYLNGAGANGWLRLNAAGSANDRTSINLNGHSASGGDSIHFRTNSTERFRIHNTGSMTASGTISPSANNTYDLGGSSTAWRNVYATGNLDLTDSGRLMLGTGDDLQIYHSGSASKIDVYTTGLEIATDGSETLAKFNRHSSVELWHDGTKRFETTSAGVQVTGALNVTTTMHIPDGTIGLQIGNSNDLKLYHDGSHSFIRDTGTGGLRITTDSFNVLNSDNNESMITATEDGGVKLYHNHNLRLETEASRTLIRGSGGLGIYGDSGSNQNGHLTLHPTGSAVYTNIYFYNAAGNSYASIIGHAGGTLFFTGGTNGPLRHRVSGTGFHSFQEGNTQRVTITAGGTVNIGGDFTNTTGKLKVTGQTNLYGNGNAAVVWGNTGYSGHLSYDGSDNAVIRAASGKALIFQTNHVNERLRINSSGHVSLGGSNVTDVNMITVNGSGASQNVGIVFNKTNSPARAYGINVNNTSGDLIFFDYTANSERVRITSEGYLHLGNSGHGTNKVGGQAITGQDLDAVVKLYSSNSNLWLAQLRADNTTTSGVFMRAGTSSSNYTLYATGYDENNPHLIVRGDGAVLIGESSQSGMQRGDVVVHASIQSGNENEPSVIHRNSSGAIIYFEYYFQCTKGGGGNSHTVNQDIIQIQNIGNFHQAVFHCWMGVRLQGQGDSYTRPATWQTGVNRFNGGSTIQKEENWISADSAVQTYANLHVGNANSTSYYIRMNWPAGTYGSSFAGGKIIGSFLACDVANSNITFAYGRT